MKGGKALAYSFIAGLVLVFIISIPILIIGIIIALIIALIKLIVEKNIENKKTEEQVEIKENSKIRHVETPYDYLFEYKIRKRGENYFFEGRVENFKREKNICTAVVRGQKNYNVKLDFCNKELDDYYCECPYYEEENFCKHIYAVILKYLKSSKRTDYIIEEKENVLNTKIDIVEDIPDIEEIDDLLLQYEPEEIEELFEQYDSDDLPLDYKINYLLEKTDELKDNYGLSDYEEKIMKEEGYEPYNFEEEYLEDDDFYNEDID